MNTHHGLQLITSSKTPSFFNVRKLPTIGLDPKGDITY